MKILLLKYTFSFVLFFSFSTAILAQMYSRRQFGRVVDENNKPVEFALIRVNNSTISTESDSVGNFKIDIPENVFNVELIVSRIGFEAIKIENKNLFHKKIIIVLKTNNELGEIKIIGERSKYWKRKLKIFKDKLLGDTPYAASCDILNENDIVIDVSENKEMVVTFKNNLKIHNKALGYVIEFDLKKATIADKYCFFDFKSIFFNKQTPINLAEENRWSKNREDAFANSLRGFLSALIYYNHIDNFELYQEKTQSYLPLIFPYGTSLEEKVREKVLTKVKLDTLARYDSLSKKYTIVGKKPFLMFSLKNFSTQRNFIDSINEHTYIAMPEEKLVFDKYGFCYSSFELSGFFGKLAYSNMLPQDYLPEKYLK